jgi:hypothetical protein
VKAKNPYSMNPYLIGCEMWEDIVDSVGILVEHDDKWKDIEELDDREIRLNDDNGDMKGNEIRCSEVLQVPSNDWMFMHNVP